MMELTHTSGNDVIDKQDTGFEISEPGTPEAVASCFATLIMAERRRSVTVSVRDGSILVLDNETNKPIQRNAEELFHLTRPDLHADPSVFTQTEDIDRFFKALRKLTGPQKLVKAYTMPTPFTVKGHPRCQAVVTRIDLGENELRLETDYDVTGFMWRWYTCRHRIRLILARH